MVIDSTPVYEADVARGRQTEQNRTWRGSQDSATRSKERKSAATERFAETLRQQVCQLVVCDLVGEGGRLVKLRSVAKGEVLPGLTREETTSIRDYYLRKMREKREAIEAAKPPDAPKKRLPPGVKISPLLEPC